MTILKIHPRRKYFRQVYTVLRTANSQTPQALHNEALDKLEQRLLVQTLIHKSTKLPLGYPQFSGLRQPEISQKTLMEADNLVNELSRIFKPVLDETSKWYSFSKKLSINEVLLKLIRNMELGKIQCTREAKQQLKEFTEKLQKPDFQFIDLTCHPITLALAKTGFFDLKTIRHNHISDNLFEGILQLAQNRSQVSVGDMNDSVIKDIKEMAKAIFMTFSLLFENSDQVSLRFNPFANPENKNSWKTQYSSKELLIFYARIANLAEEFYGENKKAKLIVSINRYRHAHELNECLESIVEILSNNPRLFENNDEFKSFRKALPECLQQISCQNHTNLPLGNYLDSIDICGAEVVLENSKLLQLLHKTRELKIKLGDRVNFATHLGDPNHFHPAKCTETSTIDKPQLTMLKRTLKYLAVGNWKVLSHLGAFYKSANLDNDSNEYFEALKDTFQGKLNILFLKESIEAFHSDISQKDLKQVYRIIEEHGLIDSHGYARKKRLSLFQLQNVIELDGSFDPQQAENLSFSILMSLQALKHCTKLTVEHVPGYYSRKLIGLDPPIGPVQPNSNLNTLRDFPTWLQKVFGKRLKLANDGYVGQMKNLYNDSPNHSANDSDDNKQYYLLLTPAMRMVIHGLATHTSLTQLRRSLSDSSFF